MRAWQDVSLKHLVYHKGYACIILHIYYPYASEIQYIYE